MQHILLNLDLLFFQIQSPEVEGAEKITRACFLANGEQLLVGCASGAIQLWKNWAGHTLSNYQVLPLIVAG